MPKKSKLWWLWNVIFAGLSPVPASIVWGFPEWVNTFVVAPVLLVVPGCLLWVLAIANYARFDLGGYCVHCPGPLSKHKPASEFYPDGFCLCGVPLSSCGCLGYQPSRRWLDNLPKEDRTNAKDLGGVTR